MTRNELAARHVALERIRANRAAAAAQPATAVMTNSHEQAERAGFDSLDSDRREAIERYKAGAARARRIAEQAPELARVLSVLVSGAGDLRVMDAIADARVALDKIEGRAS